jgi:hypothetical protein
MKRERGIALLAAVAVCAIGTTVATAGQQATVAQGYKVVGKIGKEGKANGQFSGNAYGVAIDKAGDLYVADSSNLRIQEFSAAGAYRAKWTFAPGENVIDVAVGPTGDVWGTTDVLYDVRRFPKGGGGHENLTTPKASEGIAVDADGNVYVSTEGDEIHEVVRFDKIATGWSGARTWARGLESPGDIEVSPDGTIYVADKRGSPPAVKRYDASGKLLSTIRTKQPATAGAGALYGIGVDQDCNLWATNAAQRRVDKFSASGKLLGTVTSGDLVATDIGIGPKGDLYVFDINTRSVIHFAEDKKKPATANVPKAIAVKGGKATVAYRASGFSCPAQVAATATLKGAGVSGKAAVNVAAGKTTVITMPVKAPKGMTTTATFTIVLKTNGRPTTQTKSVRVKA